MRHPLPLPARAQTRMSQFAGLTPEFSGASSPASAVTTATELGPVRILRDRLAKLCSLWRERCRSRRSPNLQARGSRPQRDQLQAAGHPLSGGIEEPLRRVRTGHDRDTREQTCSGGKGRPSLPNTPPATGWTAETPSIASPGELDRNFCSGAPTTSPRHRPNRSNDRSATDVRDGKSP